MSRDGYVKKIQDFTLTDFTLTAAAGDHYIHS